MCIQKSKASPLKVWRLWTQAHALKGEGALRSGATGMMEGRGKKIAYTIEDVVEGRSFSIRWKGFGVCFVFLYSVAPYQGGSEICYDCEIRGAFGWMVRWFLLPRIRSRLESVLKDFIARIEH